MRRLHDILEHWSEKTPAATAVVDFDGRHYDYGRIHEAARAARDCLREAGVKPGDRVFLVGENCLSLAAFIFGVSMLDAWMVPLNARMAAAEMSRIADHARPRLAVFTHAVSDAAGAHADTHDAEEVGGSFGTVRIAHLDLSTMPEQCFDEPADQVAALFYTTGTTGAPKGVMLTHRNLISAAQSSRDIRGMTPEDIVLSVVPMTHIFGFSSTVLAGFSGGATIRFLSRFDPRAVFQAFAEGVSVMPAVPQIYPLLMQYAEAQGWTSAPAPRLKYISAGGAPLDADWKRRVEAFFGTPLHNGYGMTEASPGICATRIGMRRDDIACGPPLDGQKVCLAPPQGRDDLIDGVGEILCRGPNVMKGYYRNPEATAAALSADGWLRTGDLGQFTEDGALMVVGRCKELIIRSGFNVYPPEVESALTQHPNVALSAVVGRALDGGNEEIIAFIQRRPNVVVDSGMLDEHLKPLIAPYKRPNRYVIVDTLPAASTGKILKHKLLEHFADELVAE